MSAGNGQKSLFGDLEPPEPEIGPWRRTRLEERLPRDLDLDLRDPDDLLTAQDLLLDVIVRNRELLKALHLRGEEEYEPGSVERLLEAEEPVVADYVRLRILPDEVESLRRVLGDALESCAELEKIRAELLRCLGGESRRAVLAAESRVKVHEAEVQRALAPLELAVAEEAGDLVELELDLEGGFSRRPRDGENGD